MSVRSLARLLLLRGYPIFVVLVCYELMNRFGLVSPRLLPSLYLIWSQLLSYTLSGDLPYHAWISFSRAMTGFVLALVVGFLFGTAIARIRAIEILFEPVFSFSYPVPKIALYPILVLAFGLGTVSTVALVFLECLYPIVFHVFAGMRSTEKVLVWAARNMGATPRQMFFKVLVPSALPIVFTGLRTALPVALIVTIATELIGESRGLGYFVTYASSSFDYARAFAGLLVVGVIGFMMDRTLLHIRYKVVFWQRHGVEPI